MFTWFTVCHLMTVCQAAQLSATCLSSPLLTESFFRTSSQLFFCLPTCTVLTTSKCFNILHPVILILSALQTIAVCLLYSTDALGPRSASLTHHLLGLLSQWHCMSTSPCSFWCVNGMKIQRAFDFHVNRVSHFSSFVPIPKFPLSQLHTLSLQVLCTLCLKVNSLLMAVIYWCQHFVLK